MLLIMLQACIEDTIEGVGKSSIREGEEIPKSKTSDSNFSADRIDHQNLKMADAKSIEATPGNNN
ncbi:hypothetical protein Scep_028426 [Stephania cephalantha]|uniref:Uncharacterized protein n=1 Tax=Stephania cephalantha TaxID=152367 RepID=A0AAP0E9X3_9MAGN